MTDISNTELKLSLRLAHMSSGSTKREDDRTEREMLCSSLGILQNVIRNKNRYVHEFKMIYEIYKDVNTTSVLISADARPSKT